MAIKAVGFDFDDTLIISEKDKGDIFEEIFYAKFGKRGAKKCYVELRGKANREEKIKKIMKMLLNRDAAKKEVKELSYAFSKGYEYKMSSCPLVQCTNMLREVKKQTKFMFLLSLEDKKDVVNVAKHCGIARYFDEILGGPKSKIINLMHVLDKHHVKPEETIYIGDSKGDIINSKRLKIKAVGIGKKFDYQKILKKLGADFTFSSLCDVPFERVMK